MGEYVVNLLFRMRQSRHGAFALLGRDGIEMGKFGEHILGRFTKLRTVLNQIMASRTARRINAPRHRVDCAPVLGGEIGRDQRAAGTIGFHHHRALRHTRNDTIPNGKTLFVTTPAKRKLRDHRALLSNTLVKFDVLSRIYNVQPRAEHGDCSPTGSQCPFVRRAVNAPSAPAYNRHPRGRQLPSQPLSSLAAV